MLHCTTQVHKQLFPKGNLAWRLNCFFKWPNPFSDGMRRLSNKKCNFSRYDKVQNPGYGWLQYSRHNWKKIEKKKEKKKNANNCKAIYYSSKHKKEAYVLSKWQSLRLNKCRTIYNKKEKFSVYASKVNLIPSGCCFVDIRPWRPLFSVTKATGEETNQTCKWCFISSFSFAWLYHQLNFQHCFLWGGGAY